MTLNNFSGEYIKAFVQNQKLTIALAASMLLNAAFGLYILLWATNARTIMMPPFNPTKEFWVAGDSVSASYLEQIGVYIAETIYNVSPESAKLVKPAILPLVPTEFWRDIDNALGAQLAYITDNAIVRVFHPSRVRWQAKNRLYVDGVLKDMSGDIVTKTQKTTITILYKIQNGRFYLMGIAEGFVAEEKDKGK